MVADVGKAGTRQPITTTNGRHYQSHKYYLRWLPTLCSHHYILHARICEPCRQELIVHHTLKFAALTSTRCQLPRLCNRSSARLGHPMLIRPPMPKIKKVVCILRRNMLSGSDMEHGSRPAWQVCFKDHALASSEKHLSTSQRRVFALDNLLRWVSGATRALCRCSWWFL
jgi:hypothetical protein